MNETGRPTSADEEARIGVAHFTQPSLALDAVKTAVASVTSPELIGVGRALEQSADNVCQLAIMPLVLLKQGQEDVNFVVSYTEVLANTGLYRAKEWSDDQRAAFDADLRRLQEQRRVDAAWQHHSWEHVYRSLEALLSVEPVQRSARAMVYAVVANAWTMFECLAKDAWICALNTFPLEFAQKAFNALEQDDPGEPGLTRKHLSVGILAKHGFNVISCLGTLLADRLDLTGVKGIRAAYRAAFGCGADEACRTDAPLAEGNIGQDMLEGLECARHCIVHRGGRVDAEYVRRSGQALTIGSPVAFGVEYYAALVNAGMMASSHLLSFVDCCMAQVAGRVVADRPGAATE